MPDDDRAVLELRDSERRVMVRVIRWGEIGLLVGTAWAIGASWYLGMFQSSAGGIRWDAVLALAGNPIALVLIHRSRRSIERTEGGAGAHLGVALWLIALGAAFFDVRFTGMAVLVAIFPITMGVLQPRRIFRRLILGSLGVVFLIFLMAFLERGYPEHAQPLLVYAVIFGTFTAAAVAGVLWAASARLMTTLARMEAANRALAESERSLERKVEERTAQLAEARDEAQQANAAKSTFLANMSHELRTPLNAIIGYSEMLQEEAQDDGNESYVPDLGKIQGSGRHLLELINGVLDLAKIESGKMDVYAEDFDVAELVRGVEGTIQPLVRKNVNQLELHGLDGLGSMHSDTTKVRQMLFNLLSNASKFTRQGTIRLEAERRAEDGEDWLRFRVKDSGIGMNAEQLGKVFDEFSQADVSTTKEYGGTGLGLPITKKFCEMLGGSIEATSEPGRGSTFEIRLPVRAPAPEVEEERVQAEGEAAVPAAAGAPTVLVIDDDASARDLMSRFLGGEGYGVLTAADGEEGLRLAREGRPDLITLDVVMPRVDGWAVLQQLKADPELAGIPVILLTITDDRNLGFALGAAEYLTKPIDRDQLAAVLRRYEGGDPKAPALVVDDEPNARDMLRRGLERAGWPVVEAENGRVALDRMAEAVPRLILLDLMMPVMDGFAFVAELRQNEAWREVPVLVVTAKEVTAEERARLEGHVARILQKGAFGQDDLLREVRGLVGRRA